MKNKSHQGVPYFYHKPSTATANPNMTQEQYRQLSPTEKILYDELNAFATRLTLRMEEIIMLLKKAIVEDNP